MTNFRYLIRVSTPKGNVILPDIPSFDPDKEGFIKAVTCCVRIISDLKSPDCFGRPEVGDIIDSLRHFDESPDGCHVQILSVPADERCVGTEGMVIVDLPVEWGV